MIRRARFIPNRERCFSAKSSFPCPEMPTLSGDGEDYVADSEDEASKNFKDRVRIRGQPQAKPSIHRRSLALTTVLLLHPSPPTAVHEAILQDQTRHLRPHAEGAHQTQDGQEGLTVDGQQTQIKRCTKKKKKKKHFPFLIYVGNICRLST